MDPSLLSTSDGPAATIEELVPPDEPVCPTTVIERLHQSVVLLCNTAQQLNDIIRPYNRVFVKHVAAELRKQQSNPKPNLVDLCRTTNVMDAALKKALLSGSWASAKKK